MRRGTDGTGPALVSLGSDLWGGSAGRVGTAVAVTRACTRHPRGPGVGALGRTTHLRPVPRPDVRHRSAAGRRAPRAGPGAAGAVGATGSPRAVRTTGSTTTAVATVATTVDAPPGRRGRSGGGPDGEACAEQSRVLTGAAGSAHYEERSRAPLLIVAGHGRCRRPRAPSRVGGMQPGRPGRRMRARPRRVRTA